MDKDQLLTSITKASAARLVSSEEIQLAWQEGRGEIAEPRKKKLVFTNILTGIGGAVVALGLFLFFQQHWQELGTNMRIFVTLGFSIILYIAGTLLSRTKSMRLVAWALFLVFALLAPFGIWVTFNSLHVQFPFFGYETIIPGIMFVWLVISFFLLRMGIFTVFSVISGSILYFSLTGDFLSKNPAINMNSAFEYRFLLLGISYLLLGNSWKHFIRALSTWMYAFGSAMFLGAAMALGGFSPSANLFWEIIFPGLALGFMLLSVPLKSRAMLAVSSFYLMGYIIKITAEYFSDTLGWPIALIISGFALIGIGYGTLIIGRINREPVHPAV